MRIFLNRLAILLLTLLIMIGFYRVPKSTVAYNTKNLTQISIVAKK